MTPQDWDGFREQPLPHGQSFPRSAVFILTVAVSGFLWGAAVGAAAMAFAWLLLP